jgi:5-methylcytosine-specific restriction endonuclease McrA
MIKICPFCKKEYKTYRKKTVFCSAVCYFNSMRGKSLPERKKGKFVNCPICNKSFWTVPSQNKKYCSSKCALRGNIINKKGIWGKVNNSKKAHHKEQHWNWRGGISKFRDIIRQSEEHKKWRWSVFIRDNFTCQQCGRVGGILNAHHIKSFSEYPELRFDIKNGLTLCRKCHYLLGHQNINNRQLFNLHISL